MYIIMMLGIFLILLFSGCPIFLSLVIPTLVYMLVTGAPLSSLSYNLTYVLSNFVLVAVPLFMLMGALGGEATLVAEKMYRLAKAFYRNRRGYSLRVNVMANLIFSGVSGSMLADICALSPVQIKAAESEGFDPNFAAALSISGATVGPIFPPSIPLVVFAMLAEVSCVRALLAGVLSGIVLTACLYVYVVYRVYKEKEKGTIVAVNEPIEKILPMLWEMAPIILVAPFILFSMFFGIFSPTEAGAAGIVYFLLLGVLYRTITLRKLGRALSETMISVSALLLIVAAGAAFSNALVREGAADILANIILSISRNPIVVLMILNLLLLIAGCLMEGLTLLLLATPLFLPITKAIGIDPYQLGIVMVLNISIGLTTPPFGMGLFAILSMFPKTTLGKLVRAMIPLYIVLFIALIILTLFPSLSTWLPDLAF